MISLIQNMQSKLQWCEAVKAYGNFTQNHVNVREKNVSLKITLFHFLPVLENYLQYYTCMTQDTINNIKL